MVLLGSFTFQENFWGPAKLPQLLLLPATHSLLSCSALWRFILHFWVYASSLMQPAFLPPPKKKFCLCRCCNLVDKHNAVNVLLEEDIHLHLSTKRQNLNWNYTQVLHPSQAMNDFLLCVTRVILEFSLQSYKAFILICQAWISLISHAWKVFCKCLCLQVFWNIAQNSEQVLLLWGLWVFSRILQIKNHLRQAMTRHFSLCS